MPGAPKGNGYRLVQVDGVDIFMHPGLAQVADAIRLDLGGFWKLRWLTVSGAAPLSACSF